MAFNTTFTHSFITDLDALLARNGLARSMTGNTITIIDNDGAAEKLGRDGRWIGLEARDYGAIFTSNGKRFKLVGVKNSSPKYPISGECCSTGRGFKFTKSVIPDIIAQRGSQPAPTPTQHVPASVAPTAPAHNPYADIATF